MTRPTSPTDRALDRRTLLRSGGIAVTLGALLAACGDDIGGSDDPGRVGNAPPPDPLPDAPVNDVVLLRTAQSIEYAAIEAYTTALGLNVLNPTLTAVVERFRADHEEHAAALAELISANGGEPYPCANPWLMDRYLNPVFGALEGSDDLVRDVLNTAHALETLAGATYQLFTGFLTEPALRQGAMGIGTDEARHAAVLAMAITGSPDGWISPELEGEELFPDDAGFPIPYAIGSTFGQVSAIELIVGPRLEDGSRFEVVLQTPAENSYVYEYMDPTC